MAEDTRIVGSYQRGWTYWAENHWTTGEAGFITIAPSGARWDWFADEVEAFTYISSKNLEAPA